MEPNSLIALLPHLIRIEDPRRGASVLHPLFTILFIAICAVIAGAGGWVAIAEWGEAKKDWLTTFLKLPHGIPSHDTFRRVFSILPPDRFQAAFIGWTRQVVQLTDGEVVAVDGKTNRRSGRAASGLSPIHLISAFAAQNGVVLGQLKTHEKSNEITAIPKLLELLELKGCLVTIDAMGCQKAIVATIREGDGDYLISVKDNQPTLRSIVEETVEWGIGAGVEEMGGSYARSEETRSGVEEIREAWVLPAPDDLYALQDWTDLRSVLLIRRTRREGGAVTEGNRLFISSVSSLEGGRLLSGAREHWFVENQLHWSLDVNFGADRSRASSGHSAENLSRLHHIALNLLRAEKTAKVGLQIKRNKAGWDHRYLLKVLGFS